MHTIISEREALRVNKIKAEAFIRGPLFALNAERKETILLVLSPNSAYPKCNYNQLKLIHDNEPQYNYYTYTQRAQEYDECSV